MTPSEAITAILALAVAIGGGTGIWSYATSRHRPAIDRSEAAVAAATGAGELALTIAERADARSISLEGRVETLETRLDRWSHFGHDLHQRWPIHRQSETPPPLPE